jgi:hypothetical protein
VRVLAGLWRLRRASGCALRRSCTTRWGQRLTAVMLQLDGLSRRPGGPALGEAREGVREGLEEVRFIARRLRPEALDHLGLPSALAALTNSFRDAGGVAVERRIDPSLPALRSDVELVLYRVDAGGADERGASRGLRSGVAFEETTRHLGATRGAACHGRWASVRIVRSQTPASFWECESHRRLAPYDRRSSKRAVASAAAYARSSTEGAEGVRARHEGPEKSAGREVWHGEVGDRMVSLTARRGSFPQVG